MAVWESERCAVAQEMRDEGVSPVVGMILVLAISVVGIAAILYWGLPAIDEMKANVEYRSVQTQFAELDGTIRELVAGTTEKTAKRWQPSINRGAISVVNNSEPWLYSMETRNNSYNSLTWGGFVDGDHTFSIRNIGSDLANVKVEAYMVTGTTALTSLNVTMTGLVPTGRQVLATDIVAWPNQTTKEFLLYVKDFGPATTQKLQGSTFKIRVLTGPTVVAEAWYVNTTRVDYSLNSVTSKSVTYNNGAVIAGDSNGATVVNSPSIPPITNTSGTPRFFSRLVVLNGTAGFAGENRFDLLISLYSTVSLASYDCMLANMTDCAMSSKIYVWGTQKAVWENYLQRGGLGYNYVSKANDLGGTYLEERQWKMAYTLLESNVRMVG